MNILGIKLEASAHVLPFARSNEFRYEAVNTLTIIDNRSSFNALVEIKQSKEAPGEHLDIELVHIIDMGEQDENSPHGRSDQTMSHMHLDSIQLFDLSTSNHANKEFIPDLRITNDPWPLKQRIKFSFEGVPMDGPGTYALVLAVRSETDPDKKVLIDCDYFDAI